MVGGYFERRGVRHHAARLTRMRDASAGGAFRLLRLRKQDSKEGEIKIQHEARGKAVFSAKLMAQPAVDGLEQLLVVRVQPLFGGADVTEHLLRTGARW